MEMILSYKFQLLPSRSQIIQLEKYFSIGKYFWNYINILDQLHYQKTKKSFSNYDLQKFIKTYRDNNNEEAKLLHVHLFQEICTRYANSRSNAILKFKSGLSEYIEIPKIKDDNLKSLRFKELGNGCNIKSNKVRFNKLNIRFNKIREIEGNIKTLQIKKVSKNKYELIVTSGVDKDFSENIKSNILNNYSNEVRIIHSNRVIKDTKIVGIDVGLEKIATLSTGKVYGNPRHLKKYEKRLTELKEEMSRRIKGSKRYEKTRALFQKKHEKVKNARRDYLHKVSKEIVLTCETIVVENLNIKDMLENEKIYSNVKKSMSDASWGILYFMLKYKSQKYGKTYAEVNPAYTTQECSNCRNIEKKDLNEREHFCKKCFERMDRDLNSAIVIRSRYIKSKGLEQTLEIKSENHIPCVAWCG